MPARDENSLASIPAHFNGDRFFNPNAPQARGWLDVLRWKMTSRPARSARFYPDVEESIPAPAVDGPGARVTLINHSTVLVQQAGVNILIDPIWSERASPVSWIGPRRRRKPGVRFEDLPPIHLVLLSHNHYDHLDLATVRRLADEGGAKFIAPRGVSRLLLEEKIAPAEELDWGESARFGDLTIHGVPALHFSGRGLFDRNQTLWCGYLVEGQGRAIYFAGDTAFGPHFEQVAKRFGAPRLALLPIGAYEPRWFMSPVHMGPDEAIRAHQILGARTSVAIHHGTFQLSDEALDTPADEIKAQAPPEFVLLRNGEFLDFV